MNAVMSVQAKCYESLGEGEKPVLDGEVRRGSVEKVAFELHSKDVAMGSH